jgi:hypothetical protein
MSIWKDKGWNYDYKTINAILPMLYIGLTEYKATSNVDKINGDISAKILSYIYYSEMFNSPIKVNIPIVIPDRPVRPKNIRKRLFN